MKFFTWINIRLVMMIMVVIFLYSFTSYRNEHRKIVKTEVVFVRSERKQEDYNHNHQYQSDIYPSENFHVLLFIIPTLKRGVIQLYEFYFLFIG